MVASYIQTAFAQGTESGSHQRWREVADSPRERLPKLAKLMDAAELDVLAHRAFHEDLWSKLHSTNPLVRLNKESKRRTQVVGILPNEAAITRLVGGLVLKQNDK